MSDTPISDSTPHNVAELGMLCRRLERELNAANELIVRLQAVTNDPHALWANWLRGSVALPVGIGDVREYQDRIKRLEEALTWYESTVSDCNRHGPQGDAARHALAQDRGIKAKEAKP
jgi:hypothetical protein